MPFSCSQSRGYTLITRYRVAGSLDRLREIAADVEPSPCESGLRELAEYRVRRQGDRLELEYPGGRQTLRQGGAAPALEPRTASGEWRWSARHESEDGIVTVETERWRLEESGGRIEGGYERRVTRSSAGAPFACNGALRTESTDRYRVSGQIDERGRLHLADMSVEPETGPCPPTSERHLDSARGVIYRGHIELFWRGDRRQVLSRVAPGRATAAARSR